MIKKQRIDSKLSAANLKKSDQIELHVLVANNSSWRPENWQAWDRGSSISIGFIRADMSTALFDLRSIMIQQLRPESLPDQYVYLRHVGRGSTICSARQERSLKARDFAPPFYAHAEICILSSENMVFHTRFSLEHFEQEQLAFDRNDQNMLPSIITSQHSPLRKQNLAMSQNGVLPPVTPARLGLNNTAPIPSLERSKSPSFRSLQSLEGSTFSLLQNNELMMAEIQFLEAKRALADAHAQALRNQYILNQSVIIENGLNSEGASEEGSEDDKINEEEEERMRKEEEEERMRKEEEEQRRIEDGEEERRRQEERRTEIESERDRIREEEDEERARLLAMEEEKRKLMEERRERERQIEEEIQAEEDKTKALYDLKRKQHEKKRQAEENRLTELENVAKQEEEDLRRRKEEIEKQRKEADEEVKRQQLIHEEEMREFKRQEEMLKGRHESDDEEADAAMRLIDDLTQTPRPWQAVKDPNKKKIVRLPKEYSKEEMEEVAYLRAKIVTYSSHRKVMEAKHHDLLQRLADMEKNWDDDEVKEFESKWRPKCKEEEYKTPQLYERNRQLRLELQMLYKQADVIISHAQAKKTMDDRKGMAFPSIKNNLRINLQRLQGEVTELRKRAATAHIKYEAEKSNREGVEKEVKQLRQELINSKISSSVGAGGR